MREMPSQRSDQWGLPMNETVRLALKYASWGWCVFPLLARSKRPAVPSHAVGDCDGSDPLCSDGHLGWAERATTHPDDIATIWGAGRHGLAVATGPSNLLVVDIDVKEADGAANGYRSLSDLEELVGTSLAKRTFTVRTPSGGEHRYFRAPSSSIAPSTTGRLGPGLDTRAHGGYVVAPPTTLSAGPYRVTCWLPPVDAPRWLLDRLESTSPSRSSDWRRCGHQDQRRITRVDRYVQAAVDGEMDRIVSAPIGSRNQALFLGSIAFGQLVAGDHLDHDEALAILEDAARNQIQEPGDCYDSRQAAATIRSGFDRGLREPRILDRRSAGA